MQKLTQEEFQQRVNENSNGLYEVISEYQGKDKKVKLYCKKHNCDFEKVADAVMRREATSCPECKKENFNKDKIENLIPLCVMCHAKVTRGLAKIENRQLVDIN